ncbi:MAG: ABC transporter permease [Thermaerobacter sp.]|nr:ABC transporter permease [Thermaerobacter sp.]
MLRESLRMAWRSLVAGKLRAFLTMLGIIIGVGAVIALISIGQAATSSVTSQVQALGSNLITVTPIRSSGAVLYPQDAQWLKQVVPQISQDAPLLTGSVTALYGSKTYTTTVMGTTPPSLKIQGRTLAEGRYLVPSDITFRRRVAVIGQTVVQNLFPGQNPLGQTIEANGTPLVVVGVLKASGGAFGANQDDVILTPVTTAEEIVNTTQISAIIAEARSSSVAPLAVAQIEAVMNHRFQNQNAANVLSQDQILSTLSTITSTLTLMLGGIAGISLLVGGIGIMNIMLVTVTERTREIGLRKAIGAKRSAILLQFLVESSILSLIGGAIGALLGSGGASILSHALGWQSGVNGPAVILALVFSLAVGMVFGIWPAMRASRLDPIEALRQG